MEMGLYNNLSVKKRLESLKDALISDVNKKLIFDFVDYCFSEGLSKHRVLKYISILKNIAIQTQLDFDKVQKKDLYMFISNLERSDRS
jgi:RNAse (barnase) inhibitor barstar